MSDFEYNKDNVEVALKAVEIFGDKFIKFIEKKYKNKKEKDAIVDGYAWDKYLKQSSEALSTFRSILDGKLRNIYDTYQCTGLTNGEKEYNCNITDLTKISKRIIITGIGGIGKTTMMKHLFLDARKEGLIPIYIELRQINDIDIDNNSITDIIYSNIKLYGFDISKEVFLYTLEYGNYVFIFDAYDEIKNEKIKFINYSLKHLSNKYEKNTYIVTSRPNDEFESWGNFLKLDSMPLKKAQAISLVEKLKYGDEAFQNKFCEELEKYLFEKYESFASNPLLLTIMIITYEDSGFIPDNINEFYEQAFLTLFSKHDARKGGAYKREYFSNLSYEDFKLLFSNFCAKTYTEQKFYFKEPDLIDDISKSIKKLKFSEKYKAEDFKYDLEKAVCMIIKDGLNYNFIHRTFQEYFAAQYISRVLTDDEQKKVISDIIKKQNISSLKNFLDILKSRSEYKFKQNVSYPIFSILNEYREYGIIKYIDIIEDMGLNVKESRNDMEDNLHYHYLSINTDKSKVGLFDAYWYYSKYLNVDGSYNNDKLNLFVKKYETKIKGNIKECRNDEERNLFMDCIEFNIKDIDEIFKIIDEIENRNIEKESIDDII